MTFVGLGSTLFFQFFYDMSDEYNVDIPPDYRESFDSFNGSINSTFDVALDIESSAHKIGEGAILGGALTGGSAIIKLLLLPFRMIADANNFILNMGQLMGFPKFITIAFEAIILVLIGLLVVEAVLRFRKV